MEMTDELPHSPVLHGAEGLLVGDVIHEQEAHGSSVVSCGDGAIPLLSCCVLHTVTHTPKSISSAPEAMRHKKWQAKCGHNSQHLIQPQEGSMFHMNINTIYQLWTINCDLKRAFFNLIFYQHHWWYWSESKEAATVFCVTPDQKFTNNLNLNTVR